ncbi:MAG: pyrroloquinoline quinone-dependent dehydrogenase [Bacteroidetes bacterium]|nr:pyrroloquinoline quinone-dependent dehydrogenase [Bacteroidota bacterium]
MQIKILYTAWPILLLASVVVAQNKNKAVDEWPAYGHDAGGSRFSPLDQINDQNVNKLKVAWTFRTGELETYRGSNAMESAAFEATPIMIDNTIYFSTATNRVFALDAASGKQKWLFDPKLNLKKGFSEITSRGVSAWPAADKSSSNPSPKKIFVATIDGRLIALDASNGAPVQSFGINGTVDLKAGLGNDVSVTSPPAIIGNLVIVGTSLGDNQTINYPKGTVRAYDALTGQLRWSWNPIPQDEKDSAWKTWIGPKAHQTGGANAWSIISVDAARDLVFIPTTCPSTDYYGGERLGQNLYGNSLVVLRASTGKVVWYFQVVHHDLWDYDIAAQPMLIDITKEGKKIPAVAIGTKMGHVFILNRETGKSLFPVEERAVAASTIPGEEAFPTQPFPVLPAPLGLQKVTTENAWGFTAADKEESAKRIAQYNYKGIFTPASAEGTIVSPGNVGGINWSGMCYDARKEFLITNINWLAAVIHMLPREKANQLPKENPESFRMETGRQSGTPYIMTRDYLFKLKDGKLMMQTNPPFGTLLAIDMHDGQKKWEKPLGYMYDPKEFPESKNWGSLNLGGAIVTGGNLVFIAASRDGNFRAFNAGTGEMLWESELPAGGQATPMTYKVNGKQYVVISAGGHGKFATKMGDFVVAYALE